MRKHIAVGVRVSAKRGDFLPSADGQRRQKRGLWYGVVVESVEGGIWKVNWDNGRSTVEKYSQLQVEKENSGRLPLLHVSPINNIPKQPLRNEDECVTDGLAGLVVEVSMHVSTIVAPSSSPSHEANNDPASYQRLRNTTTPATAQLQPSLEIPSQDPDQDDD